MSRKYPSTYELPVWRLIKYMLIVWVFGVFSGVAITLIAYLTDWWQQAGMATLNFHLVHPWFFLIYGGFGSIAAFYYRGERKKRSEQEKRRKFLEEHVLPDLKQNE